MISAAPNAPRISWGKAMRGWGPGEGPNLIAFGATTHKMRFACLIFNQRMYVSRRRQTTPTRSNPTPPRWPPGTAPI